ncbi:hypothetical protein LOAG_12588 [Loa loa]|uniref:Uncharacterized protein n=1 Tax=Loa loa TaxID=7209 RepID=A0A1S0TLE2_LOALO|nr:hypothetical protein LOAG_12588 [Loa loa]EFO15920.1 hypothetical protein LOAG_12588 [Loa loa]
MNCRETHSGWVVLDEVQFELGLAGSSSSLKREASFVNKGWEERRAGLGYLASACAAAVALQAWHEVRTQAYSTTTITSAEAKRTRRALLLLQRTFRDIDMPPHRVQWNRVLTSWCAELILLALC